MSNDSWPKRIGIPILEGMLPNLDWILECLLEDNQQQKRAAEQITQARTCIRNAIANLRFAARYAPAPSTNPAAECSYCGQPPNSAFCQKAHP